MSPQLASYKNSSPRTPTSDEHWYFRTSDAVAIVDPCTGSEVLSTGADKRMVLIRPHTGKLQIWIQSNV